MATFILRRLGVMLLTMLCLSVVVFMFVNLEPNLRKLAIFQTEMRASDQDLENWLQRNGYRDNYENAFPLLRDRGMTATFFVVTDFLDEERPAYLTWEMAREMYAGGMSIESHGRNHASLKGQNADYLVWQALGSLETIEHELGVRPHFVSYPAGAFDQLTIDIFKSADYWAGATTVQGATPHGADPFRLPRVRVRNTTTPDDLSELLALDW